MRTRILAAFVAMGLIGQAGQGQTGAIVADWAAPASASPGARGTAVTTTPLPFLGVAPCRIVDTRGPAGPFGGPALAPGVSRDFALPSGPCAGLPGSAKAYSLNVTATNTSGPGFLKVYPQGGPVPVVSTLNYVAGETVANAAIIAAGTGGGITVVAGVSGTDLIIDIDGYFSDVLNLGQPFSVQGSVAGSGVVYATNSNGGGYGVWGDSPTGIGVYGTSAGNVGVKGHSGTYNGLWGESLSQDGLYASGGRDGAYIQGARNGIISISTATTGQVYGVYGATNSSSMGVSGVLGYDNSFMPASSFTFFSRSGVLGFGMDNGVQGASISQGTSGVLFDALGNVLAVGLLGWSGHYGVYSYGDTGATGTKSFIEPHPTDAAKVIRYVSLEGPEAGTYFRGAGRTVHGQAVIEVPESFRLVTDAEGLTIQLTPLGAFAELYAEDVGLDRIVVRSSKDVAFHYLVQGIRRAFRDFQAVGDGEEFRPRSANDRMPAWLTEEAKRRLIANGTYNADGTVNMETAERLGWTQAWADREARARAAAAGAPAVRTAPEP
ncbi:MAG TPA: hypothetical protein VKE50_01855 [Thermoanaerobaculia bacterium]|nr:hypothetical protein [Thermoanaerobaculia bacterium]